MSFLVSRFLSAFYSVEVRLWWCIDLVSRAPVTLVTACSNARTSGGMEPVGGLKYDFFSRSVCVCIIMWNSGSVKNHLTWTFLRNSAISKHNLFFSVCFVGTKPNPFFRTPLLSPEKAHGAWFATRPILPWELHVIRAYLEAALGFSSSVTALHPTKSYVVC